MGIIERMSEMEVETALPPDLAAAVTGLHDTLTLLLGYDTASLTAPGLMALTVQVETIRRRLAALDHVLIAEIDSRHLAVEHGATSTAALLRPLLRIAPREASRRVKAAADVGPRRTLTGEPLPALFEGVFAAQASGVISAEHAAIVVGAVNYLPDAIQADCDREVEATLVDWATQLEPELLRKSAKLLVEALNPDGVFSDDRHHQRVRGIAMSESSDGMFDLHARLTPICAAIWQPIFDSLARPVPAVDGAADERQPAQRMHDAFHDAGLLLLRSGELV